MATYTITTPVNIDSLTAKAGADTYNINGGYLTIDQDTRYGTNQNTSAGLGNINLSATLGGTLEINSTKVRLIPFNTGSGVVPAYDTVITDTGTASAKLLGVYSALNLAPLAVGAAMPASGFIKVRQWNSIPYTIGALTGIGANATATDSAGWLEIVAVDALLNTINRLNNQIMEGDWYEFQGAVTDGVRATTYQIPSNGSLVYTAGVWVETAVASGIYEMYPCAGTIAATSANIATDATRGKVCWIDTSGLVRFGHDGVNSTGGYIPSAGLKIRIGNIFLVCCTSASKTVNVLPNATLATRYEFAVTGGGVMSMDKVMCNWYMNLNQPFSIDLTNVGVLTNITLTECASPIAWENIMIGQESANSQTSLIFTYNFAGGTIDDITTVRASQASNGFYCGIWTDCSGFDITNYRVFSLVKAANATTGSLSFTRTNNITLNNTILGGGRFFLATCLNVTATNSVYYDNPSVNTLSTIPFSAFDTSSNCVNCVFDGLTFGGLYMTQPYNGILSVSASGCSEIYLKNIGTYASPLSLGKPRVNDGAWSRVTTTATVTEIAHGYLVNDQIYVVISDNAIAIVVGLKTITAVTANTFTFTCVSSGSTSGVISYFGAKCANLFTLASGAAANGIYIQRCYAPQTRTNLYTGDNSSKNIVLENVFSDYVNVPVFAVLNGSLKNISGTPSYSPQTSIYGTHWEAGYVCEVASAITSQSYTRSTTTVTVTSVDHGLRTGMIINVNPSIAPTTFTAASYSVTCVNSYTFTITVANAGAASGSLDYQVANGRIAILMNEATAETANQYVIGSGNPAFTSAGGLVMPTIGDEITFITPDYIIGQGASFPVFEAIMAGGTITNYDILYQLDKNDGNGYGASHNLSYPRTGAGGTSGTAIVTMTNTTGVEVNDYVFGTGISPMAQVVSVDNATQITVSINNIATVSGILRFNHLPFETGLDPELGVKMKWSVTASTASVTAITSLYIQSQSTIVDRAYQYPLTTVNAIFSFSGLEIGTEVVLFDSSNVELDRQVLLGTTYEYAYTWNSNDGDLIGNYALIWKDDKFPIKFTGIDLTDTSLNVPISQADDLVYETGGTTTPLTINYGSKLIIMDTGTVELDVPETYSKWKDDILLTNNAQYDFAFTQVGGNEIISPKSIPKYVFQTNGWKFRPQEASHTLNVTNGIVVGESGADPFVDTIGSYIVRINYEQPVQAITVSTSGGGGATAAQVWTYANRELTAIGTTNLSAIADSVLDELMSGHTIPGSLADEIRKKLSQNNFIALK